MFKVRQTGTLRDYVVEFRRFVNHTSDVGPILLKSCFLGGPKKELRYDVKLLRPNSVHKAIFIVTQLDAKLSDLKHYPPKPHSITQPPLALPPPPTAHPYPPHMSYKKLTGEEVQRKKEKGEYWLCGEKWVHGHNCSPKQLLMLNIFEHLEPVEDESVEPVDTTLLGIKLSACAFYGTNAHHEVKIMKSRGSWRSSLSQSYMIRASLIILSIPGCLRSLIGIVTLPNPLRS